MRRNIAQMAVLAVLVAIVLVQFSVNVQHASRTKVLEERLRNMGSEIANIRAEQERKESSILTSPIRMYDIYAIGAVDGGRVSFASTELALQTAQKTFAEVDLKGLSRAELYRLVQDPRLSTKHSYYSKPEFPFSDADTVYFFHTGWRCFQANVRIGKDGRVEYVETFEKSFKKP